MNYDSILIITYGRSGSTLLQGVLNSIEGCLIRGENNNFCFNLFQCWKSIEQSKKWYSPTPQYPLYGSELLNERLFLSQCKNLIYALLLADRVHDNTIKCYGFKEIRYTTEHIGNSLEGYLFFLEKVFPNVAFIFNTRKLDDVSKSMWWAKRKENEVKFLLGATEKCFFEFHEKHANSFLITYEDIVKKTSKLVNMFAFIGATYNEKKIDEILSMPHSYNGENIFPQTIKQIL